MDAVVSERGSRFTRAVLHAIVLLAAWWLGVRRFFRGPPTAGLTATTAEPPRPG